MRAVDLQWSHERAVADMVFRWLDAEEADDAAREATIIDPAVLIPLTPRQVGAKWKRGEPVSVEDLLRVMNAVFNPPPEPTRKRGRPKQSRDATILPDAEMLCLRIAEFLRGRYREQHGIRQRAIELTVERLKLYEVDGLPKQLQLTARKLRNYMARSAGDRRRL